MTIQSDNARLPLGSFTFVLHSHLPYVLSHGTWPHGTDWLHEAAAETYIPLLNAFNKLRSEGVSPRVSIGLTPILCEMLADENWKTEFEDYLAKKIESAASNAREFASQNQSEFHDIARFWESWYRGISADFTALNRDILGAFKKLQDEGALEIITSAATHGYLPLLGTDESVQAQIAHGVANYQKHFGQRPRGIWLPECAYRPRYLWHAPEEIGGDAIGGGAPVLRKGIEEFLAEHDIKYFVVDAHLLKGGKEVGTYGERYEALRELHIRTPDVAVPKEERTPLQPYLVAGKTSQPVAFFTRHEKTALQVWSGEHGYPGDGHYLDFHKKHFPGGHRLWRVTHSHADLAEKLPYQPHKIDEITTAQAEHFVSLVKDSLREYQTQSGESGVVCAPYDAELFGHWWHEGPQWLEKVLRLLWHDEDIDLTSGARYLEAAPPSNAVELPEGSWGEGGFHSVWLNENTAWTWREIYACETRMRDLARAYAATATGELREVLEQCARELLLMESSDWQFLISTVSARDYAELRCAGHVNVFRQLADIADKIASGETLNDGDRNFLDATRKRDRIFSEIDLSQWANLRVPA